MSTPTAAPTDPRGLAGELLARTGWSPSRLAAHQRERLTPLVQHVVTASRYYRDLLGPDAVDAPLHELPTLSKATLMTRFDDIITDPRLRLAPLQAHLAGPHATEPHADHLVLSTSGSTGEPAVFVYSRAEMAHAVAGLLRAMAVIGVRADTRLVGIGAPSSRHISRHLVAGLAAGARSSAPRLAVTTPLPEIVAALNGYQPEAFPTNASLAALLAEEQLAGRLRIAPRIVITTSEVLTADMRARIRAAWGIEPHQLYATTETAVAASTSPRQVGLHVWSDQIILEVVDAHGAPVPPGTPGHRVLATNLVNHVQPLIRYEISDQLTLAAGPDPAGWPFPRITAIDGRSDDIVNLDAPGGGTVAVHPLHLRAPLAAFPDVVQYQIAHHDRALAVRVVLRPGAPADLPDRVAAALTAGLVDAGAVPPPITVTPVPSIERQPGPAGKFAAILSPRRP